MELNTNAVSNLMDEGSIKSMETVQYIVIRLGEEQYGIEIRNINNIIRMPHITRVPKMPAYIKGVINLRGEVVPVISMRLKVGLPDDEFTNATRIIVLKLEQEGSVGFIVDEVKEVVTLSADDIEKNSYDANDEKSSLISAVGKHNGELITLFDLNTISLEGN